MGRRRGESGCRLGSARSGSGGRCARILDAPAGLVFDPVADGHKGNHGAQVSLDGLADVVGRPVGPALLHSGALHSLVNAL